MKKIILAIAVAALMSAPAFAAGKYYSAGCGLGSLVFNDDGIVQILAATTNATFSSQYFGITSGTSNCGSAGGTTKAEAQQQVYVSSNYDNLTREMAKGSGEHLNAFASLLGCSGDSVVEFRNVTHQNAKQLINSSSNADQFLDNVKSKASADPALAKSCKSLS